jgi:lantibiotic modifying enzyme
LHAADLLRGSGEMSDCLCHGTVGNLDVCQTILEASGQARVADIMREKLSALWRTTRRRGGWRTGLPKYNIGFHGLFVGTAGIGYGLLRLAAPERVPSVLWLESPRTAS